MSVRSLRMVDSGGFANMRGELAQYKCGSCLASACYDIRPVGEETSKNGSTYR